MTLRFREQIRGLSHVLLLELEQLTAAWRAWLGAEHLADGTHGAVTAISLQLPEITAPENGPANTGRLFVRDNGSGKSQLCVIFASGAIQVLATEP